MASLPKMFSSFHPFCRAMKLVFQKHNIHLANFLLINHQRFPKTDLQSRESETSTQTLRCLFICASISYVQFYVPNTLCRHVLLYPDVLSTWSNASYLVLTLRIYLFFILGVFVYQRAIDSSRSIKSMSLFWRPLNHANHTPSFW